MTDDTEELCKDAKKLMNIVEVHLGAIQNAFVKYRTAAQAAQLGFFAAATANLDDVIKPFVRVACGSQSAIKPEWQEYAMRAEPAETSEVKK